MSVALPLLTDRAASRDADLSSILPRQTEHSGEHGQHTAGGVGAKRRDVILSKLPFDCCALTLKPFETPVATREGTIYELLAIIPFLKQHGTDPMTGKKLTAGELIRLNFHRNADGVRPPFSSNVSRGRRDSAWC